MYVKAVSELHWLAYLLKQIFQILKEGDFTEIHEQLGKEVLPEEYGGTNGKLQDHLGNFL